MKPEKLTVGIMMMIEVAKTAAICVLTKVETRSPKAVVAATQQTAPTASAESAPVTSMSNNSAASSHSDRKLTNAIAIYGSCLPTRNSNGLTGVAWKLTIAHDAEGRHLPGMMASSSIMKPGAVSPSPITRQIFSSATTIKTEASRRCIDLDHGKGERPTRITGRS